MSGKLNMLHLLDEEIAKSYTADVPYLPNRFSRGEFLQMKTASDNYGDLKKTAAFEVSEDLEVRRHEVHVHEVKIESYDGYLISAKLFVPKTGNDEKKPLVLYIHGGGFCSGSVEKNYYKILCYAELTGYIILAMNYRLCPETQHPTQEEDCFACLKYGFENSRTLNIDKSKIILFGTSAGAALAASTVILASLRNIKVRKLFLLYAMLDPTNVVKKPNSDQSKAIELYGDWTYDNNYTGWGLRFGMDNYEQYVKSGFDRKILHHTENWGLPFLYDDLSGFPETYLEIGDIDIFYWENLEFHQKLLRSNVKTELVIHKGFTHGHEIHLSTLSLKKLMQKRAKKLMLD